jgi:hypothetical protein
MTEATITFICGREPMREGEYPHYTKVGDDGVTRIIKRNENCGTYGIEWFDVFKGDWLSSSYNALDIACVTYGETP